MRSDDFSKEQADVFNRLASDLIAVVHDPGTTLTPKDQHDLRLAGDDVAYASDELRSIFANLPEPAQAGDMFQFASMLIEAAYTIGRFGGTSESAKRFHASERQSALAQRSGEKSTARSGEWKSWCCEEATKIQADNPRRSSDDIAEAVRNAWPRGRFKGGRRKHRTVADYIRELRRKGALGLQER